MAKFYGRDNGGYALKYVPCNDGCCVCGIKIHKGCFEVEVEIPDKVKDDHGTDRAVVRIEADAFRNMVEIRSVSIPDSVRSIGKRAFSGCKNLNKVPIGIKVKKIDDAAFENTGFVSTPWGVNRMGLSLGKSVFHNCASLQTAYIPKDVKKINDGTFDGCDSLTTVNFGESLESIGNSAFRGCCGFTGLEPNSTFEIPGTVTQIGDRAFEDCTGFKSIRWNANNRKMKSIGNLAFYGCTNLQEVTIPGNVKRIGAGAFEKCTKLQEVDGIAGVEHIGYHAFFGDENLNVDVVKGDAINNAKFIGKEAFKVRPDADDIAEPKTPYTIVEPKDEDKNAWNGKEIFKYIDDFMQVRNEPDSRYLSYDYVHEKFADRKGKEKLSVEELDALALNLYMFLGSWGMLRNSFMLYKDYKFLKKICMRICYNEDLMEVGGEKMGRFDRLWDFDRFPGYPDKEKQITEEEKKIYAQYIKDVLELKDEMIYEFECGNTYHKPDSAEEPIDSVSDTLVSKILLAALGCVPAYDSYVRKAMPKFNISPHEITGEGLGRLLGFVRDYTEDAVDENGKKVPMTFHDIKRLKERKYEDPGYSVMKYVDMALWGYGYRLEGKDTDAEVE